MKKMRAFRNSFDDYFDHPHTEFPIFARVFYQVVACFLYCLFKFYFPTKFVGMKPVFKELKGREKGTVLVMNHVSMVEPIIVTLLFWRHGMYLRAIFKKEFLKNNFMRWVFTRVGGIPVDRGTADIKAVRRAARALQAGESIIIFPEGTRIRNKDQEAKIHGGFALLAQLAKTDVLPMAVIGVKRISPEGAKIKFPRPHRVFYKTVGLLTFESLGDFDKKEQLEVMEKAAMDTVYKLREELWEEYPNVE